MTEEQKILPSTEEAASLLLSHSQFLFELNITMDLV